MSAKSTKIPGAPFNLVRFDLCPSDVARYFDVDQPWQRNVRHNSEVIPGIQATLRDTGILRNPIHTYFDPTTQRHVVLDGKHRVVALAELDSNKRCTLFAVSHEVTTQRQAEDLFVQFNLSQPPSLAHFINIREADGNRAIAALRKLLPFRMKVVNSRERMPGAVNINRVLRVLSASFGDLPKLNRHTMDRLLNAISNDHVATLARFSRIFEAATGEPITPNNLRYRDGWFEVLFKIYIQNQHLPFDDKSWAARIKYTFGNPDVSVVLFKPRYGMRRTAFRDFILRALSKQRAPRVEYDSRRCITIEDLKRLVAVGRDARNVG
ncbi:MAG: hypothetical protein KAV82_11780 [Phycisphaerae bacterium]|nr:hypothetical protein [Phycisphaerae bacterium]